MMKRNKAILCALAGIGFITSAGTVSASAMTMNTNATTSVAQTKFTAYKVIDMIYELPSSYQLTLKDKTKVQAVRNAYNTLTEDEKKVVRYDLGYLKEAESRIQYLENVELDKAKAEDLVNRIESLKHSIGYTTGKDYDLKNETNVNKIKEKINTINAIRNDYEKLDYSIKYGKTNLVTNYDDLRKIECMLVQVM